MSRLKMTGLECGNLYVFDVLGRAPDANFSASTVHKRTGDYAMYCNGQFCTAQFTLLGTPSEIYGRVAIRMIEGAPAGQQRSFLTLYDSSSLHQLSFYIDPITTVITIRRGNLGDPVIATGMSVLLDVWYCLEYHVLIANVNGRIELKRDGILEIDYTGDTQATANTGILAVQHGGQEQTKYMVGYYDDIAINDTAGAINNSWIGQGGIVGLKPEGPGTYAEWTPSAGANWQCVDDVPPDDDTTYIETTVLDERDLYTFEDMPAGNYRVDAVAWWARAKLDEAGDSFIARLMRQDAADYVGADQGLDLNYTYESEILDAAPDATAWTPAKVNAIEAGVKATD